MSAQGKQGMISIGEFARLGRVSVRMLRHYDAIGLLRPARVDRATGYRSYDMSQLARLNRIVIYRELGFTLQQIAVLLLDDLPVAELRGMLRLRQAELAAQIATDQARIDRIAARLAAIAAEGDVPMREVEIKTIPALRVVELSATASGYDPASIKPVLSPLFAELFAVASRLELPYGEGTPLATYEPAADGVLVRAAMPVPRDADLGDIAPLEVRELPAVTAATTIHRGSMASADTVVQSLAAWIAANGYRSAGLAREVYLDCPEDEAAWVTEFQEPVMPLAAVPA